MKTSIHKKISSLIGPVSTVVLLAISLSANAQQHYFFADKQGLAIRGYDPVAYFREQQPVLGSPEYRLEWGGVVWQFKDRSNLMAFEMDPEKFAPQYGGYCSYGVSEDHLSPTDPAAWTIINDRLYLNYNARVRDEWRKDIEGRIKKADIYWPQLKEKK